MGKKNRPKPKIAVTGPGKRGKGNWWFFKIILWWFNARPFHVIPDLKNREIEDFDALLLTGGADINPERYGRERTNASYKKARKSFNPLKLIFYPFIQLYKEIFGVGAIEVNVKRDEMEFSLLKKAIYQNKPVFGVCRGMQLINVHLGGTLYHDINSLGKEVKNKKSVFPRKKISILKSSVLNKILNVNKCRINSLHNQGVDQLGDGIRIIATDENGLIQSVEKAGENFLLGVQWHPEYLPYLKYQRMIFKAFIKAAKA